MIIKVKFEGLKGQSGNYKLSALTKITGPNSTGKTTIIDALRLSIQGQHPLVGKTNSDLMSLAGNSQRLEVSAETSIGTFSRAWLREGGKVKRLKKIPAIEDESSLLRVFSPSEFLKSTISERIEILLKQSKGGKGPAVMRAFAALDLDEGLALSSPFDYDDPAYETAAEALKAAEKELIEARRAHKRDLKSKQEAIIGLVDQANLQAPARVEESEIQELRNKLLKTVESIARYKERKVRGMVSLARQQKKESFTWTEEKQKQLEELQALEKELEQSEADLLKRAENILNESELEDLENNIEKFHETEISIEALNYVQALEKGETLEDLSQDLRTKKEIEIDERKIWELFARIEVLKERAEEAEGLKCCPTCGAAGEAFRVSYLAGIEKKINVLQEEWDSCSKSCLSEKIKVDALEEACAHLERKSLAKKAAERIEINSKNLPAYKDAWTKLQVIKSDFTEKKDLLKELVADKEKYEAVQDLESEKITAEDLKSIENELEAYRRDKESIEARLKERQEAHRAYVEHGTQSVFIGSIKKQIEQTNSRLEQAEELIGKVREAMSELTSELVEPLQKGLSLFTAGVLDGVEVSEDLDVGIKGRPWGALSGSERAVIVFALSATFATWSPLSFAIIDELSTMDDERKAAFVELIEKRVLDGDLEQAILIDNEFAGDEVSSSSSWQEIVFG